MIVKEWGNKNMLRHKNSKCTNIKILLSAFVMIICMGSLVFLSTEKAYASSSQVVTTSVTKSTNSFNGAVPYNSGGYSGVLSRDGDPTARVVSDLHTRRN